MGFLLVAPVCILDKITCKNKECGVRQHKYTQEGGVYVPKLVVILSGYSCVGKGTLTNEIVAAFPGQVLHIRTSAKLAAIADILHIPKTRENLINIYLGLAVTFDDLLFARTLVHDVMTAKVPIVIVDTLKTLEQIKHIRRAARMGGFHSLVVAVQADFEQRLAWMRAREEQKDGENHITADELAAIDQLPTEKETLEIASMASVVIKNEGSQEDYLRKIQSAIDERLRPLVTTEEGR